MMMAMAWKGISDFYCVCTRAFIGPQEMSPTIWTGELSLQGALYYSMRHSIMN